MKLIHNLLPTNEGRETDHVWKWVYGIIQSEVPMKAYQVTCPKARLLDEKIEYAGVGLFL